MSELIKSAIIRGIRTFVQVFLATLAISAVGVIDVSTGRAAVLGAVSFALAAAWRAILDPAPIPSLEDPTGVVIAGTQPPTTLRRGA